MSGWLLALLVPSALWALGAATARSKPAHMPILAYPAAGFLAPAALLAWCGRPLAEQAAAWVLSLIAWAGALIVGDWQVFAAFGLLGAFWGLALGLPELRPRAAEAAAPARPAAAPPRPAPPPTDEREFAIELRCPSCGAAIAVPVYHRMARCGFCGSEHVLAGRSGTLTAVVPDTLDSEEAVKAAVAKHLRYRRYLELYDRRVAPLVPEARFAGGGSGDDAVMLESEAATAAVNAAEAAVARAADAWAAEVAKRLELRSWRRFLSPYWHRFGTLYQAAFGRDAGGGKRMEFAVVTVEASAPATPAPLPAMGKLSYLRALRPLRGAPVAALPALAVEFGAEEIDRRAQQPERRSAELQIRPIALHSALVPEVVALVYRPWHVTAVELDGRPLALLLDGGSGAVEGEAPQLGREPAPLPEEPGEPPALAPSRCPECGGSLPFDPDAVAHLCRTCFRVVAMSGGRWTTVPYLREEPRPGRWQVPFWRFPLRLRTATGDLILDLPHLTDGIDATYDQIGERPQVEQRFLVPGFRTRVSKTGIRLYRQLWPVVQGPRPAPSRERFALDRPPERVVGITLGAGEARAFARVYLALAFTQRDLARAQVKTVRERFLSATLEGEPDLVFLSLPEELIGPFAGVLGRARAAAVADLEGYPAGLPLVPTR